MFLHWPPKYKVLLDARRPHEGGNKRQKWDFQCASCSGWFPQKSVSVDHKVPVGELRSLDQLPGFVDRMRVGVTGLQVLCECCHQAKTNKEREERNG